MRRERQSAGLPAPQSIDRLPPHSIDAEQGVLGSCLLDPNQCVDQVMERFNDPEAIFYDLRHAVIMQTLFEMREAKKPIDLISIQEELKKKNQLESVGGITYLSALPDAVPSAANLMYYVDIIKEKAILRKLIRTGTAIVNRAFECDGNVEEVLDEAEKGILEAGDTQRTGDLTPVKEVVHKSVNLMESMFQNQGKLIGLPTGLSGLDKMTSGLKPGEVFVIAARPSAGKTTLAMNIAEHIAVDNKLPVGVFSLEMSSESLILRMICSRAKVNLKDISEGRLTQGDLPKITSAAGAIATSYLYIDDTPGLSTTQFKARARRMHQRYGLKALVVDYLQLLSSPSRKVENRQQEVAEISAAMKAIAKELHIPVIVLAQLNREIEKDKGRKPRLSDLRESGAIEQDGDLIGILYRPSAGKDEDPDDVPMEYPVNLLIAKQRNGPTGDIQLFFQRWITRFSMLETRPVTG